jgi:hypothetical protein
MVVHGYRTACIRMVRSQPRNPPRRKPSLPVLLARKLGPPAKREIIRVIRCRAMLIRERLARQFRSHYLLEVVVRAVAPP